MSWVPILTQLYKEIRYSPPILFLLLLTALKRCVLYYSIDTRGAADGAYIIEDGWQQHRIASIREMTVFIKAVNAGMMSVRSPAPDERTGPGSLQKRVPYKKVTK